jgi:2-oxoglutarate dehydrogenase E2 component (dihydrolipoamide succinyltransferase)
MMAGSHPSDIELLEYVEGDLEDSEAATVRAHVAACEACAATVAELEAARAILRASPLLELSGRRRERIFAHLPKQEREAAGLRTFLASPKRLVAVLAPAAVAAAVAVTLAVALGDGGGREEAAPLRGVEEAAQAEAAAPPAEAAAPAEPAPAAEPAPPVEAPAPAPEATGGAEDTTTMPEAPVLEAQAPLTTEGSPAEVAAFLRERGLDAKVVGETVEVTAATQEDVASLQEQLAKLLEERGPGSTVVVVKPSG